MTYAILKEKRLIIDSQKHRNEFLTSTYDKNFFDITGNETIYLEDEELINWEEDDNEIKAFKLRNIIGKYIESGEYSGIEVIKEVQSRFEISNQNMLELLSILQSTMINSGFVRLAESGKVILGEEKEISI